MTVQTLGFALLAIGLAVLLTSGWPLVIAGALLLLVPEIGAAVLRRRREAKR